MSLTPATTETLFALGVGDRIKGKGQDVFLYPPEAGAVPGRRHLRSVDVEKIVALSPDVVFAGGNFFTPPDAIAKLRSLGLTVVVLYAPSVEAVYKDIELIGQVTGRAIRRGAAIVDRYSRVRQRQGRGRRPADAPALLRARCDGCDLRPGRQVVPGRDDRAGRRRPRSRPDRRTSTTSPWNG